jgi:transcriptional regulator with XRE-family HTH domain
MPRTSKADHALPNEAIAALQKLGANIRAARKAKGMRQKDLAARCLLSPARLRRLENGDPGVGLGAMAQALYVLELEEQLALIGTDLLKSLITSRIHPPSVEQFFRHSRPVASIKKADLDF